MAERLRRMNQIFVILLMVLFVLSFPGVGIETRPYTSYLAWAGPIFLVLSLLIFAAGIASVVTSARRARLSGYLSVIAGLSAVSTILLDLSHVGGLPPPLGPTILSFVGLAFAALIFGFAAAFLRLRTSGRGGVPGDSVGSTGPAGP